MKNKMCEQIPPDIADRLVNMTCFIERQEQIDEALEELVNLAASALQTARCSIMLVKHSEGGQGFRLRVFSHNGHLPKAAINQETPLDETIAGSVVLTGKAVRIDDIGNSPYAKAARRPKSEHTAFLSAPIFMHEAVAGVINFSEPHGRSVFTNTDLVTARLVGLLIGRSLHVVQLQNLLKSRYLHFAISQESAAFQEGAIVLDGRNAAEMAKVLSRTFYREMNKAGFGPKEILGAATEIISLLSQRVSRLQNRQESSPEADT